MPTTIRDGAGQNNYARVTSDNRLAVDAINELVSSERSRTGNLYGVGTGYLTTSGSMNFGGVLWLRNDATDEDLYVQKLIFGWNGGSTSFNRVIRSFIKYQTTALPSLDLRQTFGFQWGLRMAAGSTQQLRLTVRDDTSGVDAFNAIAYGFERLPD